METRFFRLQCLLSLCLSAIMLVGCSTHTFRPRSELTPLQASNAAIHYLRLATQAVTPAEAADYRLRAAELQIQAHEISSAQQVLKRIQLDTQIDPSLQKIALETRLALLKKEFSKARKLLNSVTNLGQVPAGMESSESHQAVGGQKRIALLLPTRGPHAEAAKTIRDGFLAAYYKKRHPTDPAVKIYDTDEGNLIREAYQKALNDETTIIVGPLTKPEVQAISTTRLDIPVIALNTVIEDASVPHKLYQFGLMPEDEVVAVAEHALRQNHRKTLILAPDNEWGERLIATFKAYWNSHGGQVIEVALFKSSQEVEAKIRTLLRVQGTERRQDADMLFLVASPDMARQIKPLLNFYYAENLPVYATASIYSGATDPYSHRVRIVLAEKGVAVDILDIDRLHKAREEINQLNPYGAAPTLVDRELVLYQSEVIMEYLDERFPHPPLMPVYPIARARARLMMYRLNRDWFSLMDKIRFSIEAEDQNLRQARQELTDSITSIAPVFAEMPFFFSEEFSLIDCCIAPLLWRLPLLGIQLPPQAQSVLTYAERVFKRESFLASLTEAEAALNR